MIRTHAKSAIGLVLLGLGSWLATAVALAQAPAAPAKPAAPPALKLPPGVVLEADVEYGRAGTRSLKLDLLRPERPADGPLPIVVYIHGGGWRNGNKEQARQPLAHLAATGNYVCATVGYRLTGEAIWPAQIHDCKAAIRWLRANASRLGADPDRIGVFGHSAGGHLSALLGTSGDVAELEGDCGSAGYSSRVQCVVDYCGPSNFATFVMEPGSVGRTAVEGLFGGPAAEHAAEVRAASPVTWVSKDDPPFLIVHGTEDPIVPIAQADELNAALARAGVSTTYVRMEGAGHGLRGDEILARQRAFFERHLRGQDVEVSAAPIQATATK